MGICSSCDSTNVATAKLILHDGRLQEFSYPVKASYVLQKNPAYFICNSDEMDFDDVVSAISGDDVLQPGQLYFALPLDRLKSRLQAEEMAALAVKASSALARSGGEKCGCGRKTILAYSGGEKVLNAPSRKVGDYEEIRSKRERRGGGGGGGGAARGRRRGQYTALLSAIPE
ncbi:OLC1v1010006C1 [Oldenlandia corymbosa var. corymbosa]|uniref:OLC1v1010006C1 n=1 Tax=Oldenlandia corymbosa var. corymbosa TaxID=529605 RepID=A0AAV1DQT2_OLDCO|nr:OLC1v1010006C1 [Oldenlandia corymbosa var. corymbosa]